MFMTLHGLCGERASGGFIFVFNAFCRLIAIVVAAVLVVVVFSFLTKNAIKFQVCSVCNIGLNAQKNQSKRIRIKKIK